jgi:hypothetical protein
VFKREHHRILILELAYIIENKTIRPPSKAERERFAMKFDRLTKMLNLIKKIDIPVVKCFGKKLFGSRTIRISSKNFMLSLMAIIIKNFNFDDLDDDEYEYLRSTIKKINSEVKEKRLSNKKTNENLRKNSKMFMTFYNDIKREAEESEEEWDEDDEDWDEED